MSREQYLTNYLIFQFCLPSYIHAPRHSIQEDQISLEAKVNFALADIFNGGGKFSLSPQSPKVGVPDQLGGNERAQLHESISNIHSQFKSSQTRIRGQAKSLMGEKTIDADNWKFQIKWIDYVKAPANTLDYLYGFQTQLQKIDVDPDRTLNPKNSINRIPVIKNGSIESFYRICYFGNKKVILPNFLGLDRDVHYFEFRKSIGLYNSDQCEIQDEILILTDSIEIAYVNNMCISKLGIQNISWLSWDNRFGSIDKVDWSPLKRKSVYYFLIEHSNESRDTIFKTAAAVKKKLQEYYVSEIIYVSNFTSLNRSTNPTQASRNFPIFLTAAEFDNAYNGCYDNKNGPYSLDFFLKNFMVDNRSIDRLLFKPLIYENGIHFFYFTAEKIGDAANSMVLCLARSISKSSRFIEGWDPVQKSKVLYICGSMNKSSLNIKLEDLGIENSETLQVVPIDNTMRDLVHTPIKTISPHFPKDWMNSDEPKVIIVDYIDFKALACKRHSMEELKLLMTQLIDMKWTVIFLGQATVSDLKYIERSLASDQLSPNSIVSLTYNEGRGFDDLRLNLKVERSPRSQPIEYKSLPIGLKLIDNEKQWRVIHFDVPILKILLKICADKHNGVTSAEIANSLGISEANVNKRWSEIKNGHPIRDKFKNIKYVCKLIDVYPYVKFTLVQKKEIIEQGNDNGSKITEVKAEEKKARIKNKPKSEMPSNKSDVDESGAEQGKSVDE